MPRKQQQQQQQQHDSVVVDRNFFVKQASTSVGRKEGRKKGKWDGSGGGRRLVVGEGFGRSRNIGYNFVRAIC
ncbi:hypothetical protein M0802_007997 [Mischocyttarus mexicanus]|nr:hypothetical protein M0802_007997 [Mischocyttarus mexicanus]